MGYEKTLIKSSHEQKVKGQGPVPLLSRESRGNFGGGRREGPSLAPQQETYRSGNLWVVPDPQSRPFRSVSAIN